MVDMGITLLTGFITLRRSAHEPPSSVKVYNVLLVMYHDLPEHLLQHTPKPEPLNWRIPRAQLHQPNG